MPDPVRAAAGVRLAEPGIAALRTPCHEVSLTSTPFDTSRSRISTNFCSRSLNTAVSGAATQIEE